MTDRQCADVVIVGAGAGGATLGGELAEAGAKVVFLEAGNDLDITYGSDKHFAATQKFGDFLGQNLFWHEEYTGRNWRTDMGECAGGGTTTYGGVLEESRPEDFDNWPISFAEMAPYIALTKRRYHVALWPIEELSASARHLHEVTNGRLAPIQSGYLRESFDEYGVHHDKCKLCRFCLLGCKFNAKSNALTIPLPKARHFGAELQANCLVTKVKTDRSGRKVTSLRYLQRIKTGSLTEDVVKKEIFADKFVLAAGSLGTPMLLHWSGRRGRALANSSGQVGRNLRGHFARHVMGLLGDPDLKSYQGQVVELGDKYNNYEDGFLTEFNMAAPPTYLGMVYEIMRSDVASEFVGVSLKRLMRRYPELMNATPLARSADDGFTDNYVLPHARKKNKYGLPLPEIRLDPNPQEEIWIRNGYEWAREVMLQAGAKREETWVGRLDVVHKLGTCRMGTDASASVVDLDGKAWDLDNLWISDGSIFPAPLMANCAFIIYALAYKIADKMIGRETPA